MKTSYQLWLHTENADGCFGERLFLTDNGPTLQALRSTIAEFKQRRDVKGLRSPTKGKSRPVVITRITNERDFLHYTRNGKIPDAVKIDPSFKPVVFDTVQEASIALGLSATTLAQLFHAAKKKLKIRSETRPDLASPVESFAITVRGLEVSYADGKELVSI